MKTIEVPPRIWNRTLQEFSQIHEGWLVSLEVMSPEVGAQSEFKAVPLLGIDLDPADRGDAISIAVARSAKDRVTHQIHAPRKLWIERTDAGADVALDIDAEDGTRNILRLKAAVRPEEVDGMPRR